MLSICLNGQNFQTLFIFSLKFLYFYKCFFFKHYITKIHKCSQFIDSKTELILPPPIAVLLQIFLILVDDATIQPLAQAINLWVITLSLSFPTSLHHSAVHLIDSINLVDSTFYIFLASVLSSPMDAFMTVVYTVTWTIVGIPRLYPQFWVASYSFL